MERILITGSKGNIGSVLVPELSDEFEVVGLDRIGIQTPSFRTVDITDYSELENAFRFFVPKYVVHLAGNPNEDARWEEIYGPNILGAHNVYECSRRFGIKKVIFASSTHLIGGYEGYPEGPIENGRILTIEDLVKSDSDYGTSKALGELVAQQYYNLHQLNSICLRIGWFRSEKTLGVKSVYDKLSISPRDFVQLVRKSIRSNKPFGIYFGISNNPGGYLDISNAVKDLDYQPQDSF